MALSRPVRVVQMTLEKHKFQLCCYHLHLDFLPETTGPTPPCLPPQPNQHEKKQAENLYDNPLPLKE